MEMRLRAPVTRGYFFLLGALRLVNAASPRNIDQKKISSGPQGSIRLANLRNYMFKLLRVTADRSLKLTIRGMPQENLKDTILFSAFYPKFKFPCYASKIFIEWRCSLLVFDICAGTNSLRRIVDF